MLKSNSSLSQNHLAGEKSPYLIQHAHNPVDWYPWGEEAFEKARRENRPIFLSVGYSTCHWCHVMAKESFHDPEVAEILNKGFISVKVDREELPHVDQYYMTVCQALTGGGGWPLTIVMTPRGRPFFAGTYYPRQGNRGRIGMIELLPRLIWLWENQREELETAGNRITKAIEDATKFKLEEKPHLDLSEKGFQALWGSFDSRWGGFGSAPKFPTPHNLLFLLRYWKRTGEAGALEMVEKTLDAIRHGGIFDQLGFGIHRYSTDSFWLLPHFEKMLYDQALTATAFLEAYQSGGKEIFKRSAREIFTFVLRDMADSTGGFYSGWDADSEGEEGKFYTWTVSQIQEILGKDDSEFVMKVFNIEEGGNFPQEATGIFTGANVLNLADSVEKLARHMNMDPEEFNHRLEEVRSKLYEARKKRVHPHLDDKILTDWNGLMIGALAQGSKILGEGEYLQGAIKCADFIIDRMAKPDGSLLHRYREGDAAIEGLLDDYAFLVFGLIELYQASFESKYLRWALKINHRMLELFSDEADCSLYQCALRGSLLPGRPIGLHDGALPSGNSMAYYNLLRLSRITGDEALAQRAENLGGLMQSQAVRQPGGYTFYLTALEFEKGERMDLVLSGKGSSPEADDFQRAISRAYHPGMVVIFNPEKPCEDQCLLSPQVRGMKPIDGNLTAYLCRKNTCLPPVSDPEKLRQMLE